jgi:hypothetical protein
LVQQPSSHTNIPQKQRIKNVVEESAYATGAAVGHLACNLKAGLNELPKCGETFQTGATPERQKRNLFIDTAYAIGSASAEIGSKFSAGYNAGHRPK